MLTKLKLTPLFDKEETTVKTNSQLFKATVCGAAVAFSMGIVPVMAADYDLVINNGRVMDPETQFDDVANIGIKDGRIAAITKQKINGSETINANGLVVAPGFIDTHYHATDVFASKMALRDGVTTGMDLEAGSFNVKRLVRRKSQNRLAGQLRYQC